MVSEQELQLLREESRRAHVPQQGDTKVPFEIHGNPELIIRLFTMLLAYFKIPPEADIKFIRAQDSLRKCL